MSNVDELLTETLRARAKAAPPPDPVIERVLTEPDRPARHWLPVLAAAAVVILIVGTVWAVSWDRNAAQPPVEPAPVARSTPQLDRPVPSGWKELGYRDVAVRVPADWPLNRTRCGTPVADTVVFRDGRDSALCAMPPDFDNDVLEIFEPNPGLIDKPTQLVNVDDEPARVSIHKLQPDDVFPERPQQGTAVRGQLWLLEQDMVIQATSRSRAMVMHLLSGVHMLSPDEVAVPPGSETCGTDFRAVLKRLGLRVRVVRTPAVGMPVCVGTEREAYSIVPKGSTVTFITSMPR